MLTIIVLQVLNNSHLFYLLVYINNILKRLYFANLSFFSYQTECRQIVKEVIAFLLQNICISEDTLCQDLFYNILSRHINSLPRSYFIRRLFQNLNTKGYKAKRYSIIRKICCRATPGMPRSQTCSSGVTHRGTPCCMF